MRPRLAIAASLGCLMVFTACSGKSATSYSGTAKIAHALNANGVACTGFVASTKGGRSTQDAAAVPKGAKPLVEEAGTCSHGASMLLLFTFKTTALRDHWLTLGRLYGSVVVGPNWTVTTRSKDLADRVSGAIGGDVQ
jgi:hypothetical protein